MNIKIALENNFKVLKEPLLKMALDHIEELETENLQQKKKIENLQKYLDTQNSYRECAETWVKLAKAKELLEKLLITSCNSDVLNLLSNCSEVLRVRVEAEQFLSEVEK